MCISAFFPIWDRLSPEVRGHLKGSATRRSVRKNAPLHGGGSDCTGLLLVESGRLRVFLLSEDGREITLYRLGPGEVCLFSAGCMIRELRFDLFITAETDAALQVIPAEVCQGLMTESVVLSNFIGTILAKRFSQVMERVDQILWQRLDRRLAAFLLEEAALRGTDVLSITHEGISHHLGCAREVVTRLLSEFREEGWVALRRGTVELLDREALSDLGKL